MHPPGTRSLQSTHAFTLAEVMVAAVVLLIAIVGLIEAVTVGAGMLNVSRKQAIALQIIRTEIEAVHLNPTWTIDNPAEGSVTIALKDVTNVAFPELLSLKNVSQDYSLTRTITRLRPPPTPPNPAPLPTANWIRKVTLTVTWTEATGRSYSRTGYAYCAKNGFNALYQR